VCHVTIDPPGFALENFDVIGGWRKYYRSIGKGEPVIAAGKRMRYKQGPPVDAGDVLPPVADLMALAGLTDSKSDARRAIAGGGAYLNNAKVASPDAVPSAADLLHGRFLVLRRGKRTVGGAEVRTAS